MLNRFLPAITHFFEHRSCGSRTRALVLSNTSPLRDRNALTDLTAVRPRRGGSHPCDGARRPRALRPSPDPAAAPRMRGCLLMAISRHPEGSSRTSALPPKADIKIQKIVGTQEADIQCLLCPRKRT